MEQFKNIGYLEDKHDLRDDFSALSLLLRIFVFKFN